MTQIFQKLRLTVIATIGCAVLFVTAAKAQQLTADIKGTVTDATGAAVPDAQVTAVNKQTGVEKTVPSDQNGGFEVLQLPVGVYSVNVVKSGFQKFTADNIQLVLNQTYTLAADRKSVV